MIFDAAAAALLLGFLFGGSFKKILDVRLKGLWLLLFPAAVSVLPRLPEIGSFISGLGEPGSVTVSILRYGALVVFAILNISIPSVCIIGTGGLLNCVATLANGGAMPVSPSVIHAGSSDPIIKMLKSGEILNYRLMDGGTKLRPLCDIIRLRLFDIYFLSVGDIVIAVGVFMLILRLMEPKRLFSGWAALRRRFERLHA